MKRQYLLFIITISLITGCAHSIIITPNTAELSETLSSDKNNEFKVGYYISSKDKSLEVTTLGGGGDNVKYYPYRDMEDGYRIMLSNVFKSVTELNSIKNNSKLQSEIDFIIIPRVITTSGSTGFFTWPPTDFTVDLTSTIKKAGGEIIAEPRVVGTGVADTSERLSEHGIAGKRAMEDALLKMQKRLTNIDLSEKSNSDNKLRAEGSISDRLTRLKRLKKSGLISDREFSKKRKNILDSL